MTRWQISSARPVAPFAGAWIEILTVIAGVLIAVVAPFAGAWIEISVSTSADAVSEESLPSRERGLKFYYDWRKTSRNQVAPFAGAWIEISQHSL